MAKPVTKPKGTPMPWGGQVPNPVTGAKPAPRPKPKPIPK